MGRVKDFLMEFEELIDCPEGLVVNDPISGQITRVSGEELWVQRAVFNFFLRRNSLSDDELDQLQDRLRGNRKVAFMLARDDQT